jgi:hypothetical protein
MKPILLRAVKIFTKNFLSEVASKYIGEKGVEEFKTELLPKMELLAEVDKDTIYFDGIHKIENEMKNIMSKYPLTRVVVFIDDSDRCSPTKALEVFESIKVFLGIDGEQYIKKIIQIPIILPEWNVKDIGTLINDLLKNNLINNDYQDIIRKNTKLISEVVENNPREVKRFINNCIVASEIHSSNKKVGPIHFLLVQAINIRWSNFYQVIVGSSKQFRQEVKKYVQMQSDKRIAQLESDKTEEGFSPEIKRILRDLKVEDELWKFLMDHIDALLQIKDWGIYRRAAESVKEIPTMPQEVSVSDRADLLDQNLKKTLKIWSEIESISSELRERYSPYPVMLKEHEVIFNRIKELDIRFRKMYDEGDIDESGLTSTADDLRPIKSNMEEWGDTGNFAIDNLHRELRFKISRMINNLGKAKNIAIEITPRPA